MKGAVKRILAALDAEDELVDCVASCAAELANALGAELHVISVYPLTSTYSASVAMIGTGAELGLPPDLSKQELQEDIVKERRRLVEIIVDRSCDQVRPQTTKYTAGSPAHEISDYANELDVDIIVLGSHDLGFWEQLFTGSVSKNVKREAKCSVFVVSEHFCDKLNLRQKLDQ